MPHLQLVAVAHPLGGIDPKLARAKADDVVDRVIAALTRDPAPPPAATSSSVATRVDAPADIDAFQDFALAEGWSDGMPVLPPTEARVRRILGGLAARRAEVIATLAPRRGAATLEAIAVNAALAGAVPEHLRVVVAAIRALADPRFNLNAIQTTTHPCTPLVIVNGPIAPRLGINGGERQHHVQRRRHVCARRRQQRQWELVDVGEHADDGDGDGRVLRAGRLAGELVRPQQGDADEGED